MRPKRSRNGISQAQSVQSSWLSGNYGWTWAAIHLPKSLRLARCGPHGTILDGNPIDRVAVPRLLSFRLTKLFWCRQEWFDGLVITMGIWWWRGGRTSLTQAQWLCALMPAKALIKKRHHLTEIDGS